MSTKLAKRKNAIPALSVGPFVVTRTGLILEREPEWEEWQAFFDRMQNIEAAVQWNIGDALVNVEIQYGESATQLTSKYPDYEYKRLLQWRWVASRVQYSFRKELSWTHHESVAPLEPKEQKKWLEKAERKGWSVSELRQAIRGSGDSDRAWLRIYQVWSFAFRDGRYGIDHPGNIPSQILMNLNYYYTEPGDLIVDLFAGGGVTIDVCESNDNDFGNRECLAYDINPIRKDIKKRDIVKQGLPRFKRAKMIFLDPPYWKQKKGEYSDHETNLANMSLDRFHEELIKIIINCRKKAEYTALIIGPTQENWEFVDHASEIIYRVGPPWHRIQVPYSTQQHGGDYVNKAKASKKWLYLARDLMIWRGTQAQMLEKN